MGDSIVVAGAYAGGGEDVVGGHDGIEYLIFGESALLLIVCWPI